MDHGQTEIRRAEVSDVPDIESVARRTWTVTYAGIIL